MQNQQKQIHLYEITHFLILKQLKTTEYSYM